MAFSEILVVSLCRAFNERDLIPCLETRLITAISLSREKGEERGRKGEREIGREAWENKTIKKSASILVQIVNHRTLEKPREQKIFGDLIFWFFFFQGWSEFLHRKKIDLS